MGYEVKLYIVQPSGSKEKISILKNEVYNAYFSSSGCSWYGYMPDGDTRIDLPPPSLELSYSSVIAMVALCKPGYDSNIYKLMSSSPVTDSYFLLGNKMVYFDSYGEGMRESSVKDVISALKKDIKEEPYRRFTTALGLLKTITPKAYGKDTKVLFYGH
jgi:hypothetical protein